MVDRNRTDLNRDADLYREYISSSRGVESQKSAFIDRDEESEYSARLETKQESSFLSTMAKLAGLGVGAYALGRTIPKDVWVDALHKMGRYGSNTFGAALHKRNQAVAGLVDRRLVPQTAPVRGMELTDFIESELNPFLREIHQSTVAKSAVDHANLVSRSALQDKFGIAKETGRRLTGLTVDDVLAMSRSSKTDSFKVINERSLDLLEKTRAQSGDWFGRLGVDRHLHRSTYGKITSSTIKDSRWASRRALGDLAHNSLGFQIPFVGFKPIDLVTPFFRLGSKRKTFARLGRSQTIADGVKTPKTGISWLIDGDLTNFSHRGVQKLAPGRKFRTHSIDGIAAANLARLGQHPLQSARRRTSSSAPDTLSSFFRRSGDIIGVGPQYRDEASAIGKIISAAKRSRQVKSGDAVFNFRESVRVSDLPFRQRLKRQMLSSRSGSAFDQSEVVSNPFTSYTDLSWAEKLKAKFGASKIGDFKTPDGNSLHTDGLFGTSAKRPSPSSYGYRDAFPGEAVPSGGSFSNRIPLGHTALEDTASSKLGVLGHFATNRLNQLIGFTTGIGFRPSVGKWGPVLNAAKIAAIGSIFSPINGYAIEAAKYVNYMFERVANLGGHLPWSVSPSDVAIKGYEGITLGAATLKDVTGVTSIAKYSEDLMPGIVNSPLSGLVRTIGPMAAGARLGGAGGMLAGLVGASLTGGLSDVFGTDLAGAGLATSSSDLSEMYSGERKVRVRSGRWWMLNRSSFYGEGTDHYSPHWVALAKNNPEYSAAQYGSKKEYFQHASTLPTFHNLFRLARDEDYFANKHELTRPYPEKPSGEMSHAGEMLSPLPQAGPGGHSVDLGTYPIGSKTDLGYQLKDTLNDASEFLGVYKFLGETVLGGPSSGPVLGNASTITDPSRSYWDKDLGGLFGMTELLRRFSVKPDDINPAQVVNSIPNQMPTFLPGQRSSFSGDRDYYKDFTLGDPYAKVKQGEHRLPGAGYESVNPLHSRESGRYDSVDALLILADVAPYSEAYRYYKRKVQSMKLEKSWQERVDRSLQHVDEVMQGFAADFTPRRFSNSSADNLQDINDDIQYNALERFVGKQYEHLTLDALPEIGRIVPFGTLLTHKLFPHHTPEQDYLERQVYAARSSDWQNPMKGFVEPKFTTLYNENPLTAGGGAALLGLTATTPFGMLARGATAGAGMTALSATRGGYYGQLEGGYKPAARHVEENVLEYFDKLEYLRHEKAINRARIHGDNDALNDLKKSQRQNTMLGLDYNNIDYVKSAIPKGERFYYESFANAGESRRSDILQMTPRYMQDIYKAKWEPGSIQRDPNAAMSEFMKYNETPDEDWSGWNMGVQKWQIMSRTMDTADNSVAIDMHRQYVSTAMMAQARMQVPDVGLDYKPTLSDESAEWHTATVESQKIQSEALSNGFSNVKVSPLQARGRANVDYRWNITRDRRQEIRDRMSAIIR